MSDFDTATPRAYMRPSSTTPSYGGRGPAFARRHDVAVRVERDRRPAAAEAVAHDQVGDATSCRRSRRNRAGTGWRSTSKPSAVEQRRARFSAAGALSPGGVSEGTRTICRRNSTCSAWWASIQRPSVVVIRCRVTLASCGSIVLEEMQQHRRRDLGVFRGHRLVGMWLMPLLPQRTNSIAVGATAGNSIASWPAPLGRWRTAMPCAAIASANARCSAGSQGAAFAAKNCVAPTVTLRRFAIAVERRLQRLDRRAAQRVVAGAHVDGEFDVLRNDVDRARQRRRSCRRCRRAPHASSQCVSTHSIISLAAVSASRRAPIGTVPACPARPVDAHAQPRRAGDRGDDADRQVPRSAAPVPARCATRRTRRRSCRAGRRSRHAVGIAAELDERLRAS